MKGCHDIQLNDIRQNGLTASFTSGLYYKSFTIVIYDCNDSTIVIHDRNDSSLYYKTTILSYAPNWSVILIYDRKLRS